MKLASLSLLLAITFQLASPNNVRDRFPLPQGYKKSRIINGFGYWLESLPLKPVGTPTKTYRGDIARTDTYTAAVVDISVGKQDLQQCADAVMRLRAEYLYHQKQFKAINFNFVNGFKCDYMHYANGYRYSNNKWILKAKTDYSYPAFLQYMNLVFAYASTLSLEKELIKVNKADDLRAGDVFIHGGAPGHCFIILDIAETNNHEKRFLLAQSFMPAQDIQILQQTNNPWFSLSQPANIPYGELVNLKYLRRFAN